MTNTVSKRLRLFITKLFHILKIKNYSFIFRSKKWHKITKKLIAEVQRVQQTMWQNSFKQIETHTSRSFISVWMSFCHIVCCTLWTCGTSFLVILRNVLDLKKKLYILIFSMWNDLTVNRRDLLETRRHDFKKPGFFVKVIFIPNWIVAMIEWKLINSSMTVVPII